MTEHLPECPQGYSVPFTLDCCICNELRAREEQSGGLITRQRAEQIGRNIGKYGCVITEQQHLPECEAYRDECGGGCICHHVRPASVGCWTLHAKRLNIERPYAI